jgi:two-component system response regulator
MITMQASRKFQIVLIEDSPSDAKLTHYALSRLSPTPELLHFETGEIFFNYLRNNQLHQFSLILLDLNLPRMNGLEILRVFRKGKKYNRVPVVMFSSSKEETDVINSYQSGANAYVQKPITLEEFDQAMEAIVNFWSCANVVPCLLGV